MWLFNSPHAVTKRKSGEHYNKKLKTIPHPWKLPLASCHPGLITLALCILGFWLLFLPAHFGCHWHTAHLAVFVPTTELLCGAARLWSEAAGTSLKPIQTFGPVVWMLVWMFVTIDALSTPCLHDVCERICGFISDEVERLRNILVSQEKKIPHLVL